MAYPTVAFKAQSNSLGTQPINESSTTQKHNLGEILKGLDVTYGMAEFIYLAGVASTAAGDVVCYDTHTGATVRAVHGGTGANGPCAVAMSANGAGSYGWYQISGSGPVNVATVAANAALYLTSTAGQVDDAVAVGDLVEGLITKSADSAGFATCQLSRPSIVGLGGVALADASNSGGISTTTQTFAGDKTFSGKVTVSNTLTASGNMIATQSQGSSLASGTGFTTVNNGRVTNGLTSIEIDYTAWTANAQTQDIALITLPARTRVLACIADTTVAYAGLAGTIQLQVGSSSGTSNMIAAYDCKTAIVTKGLADADMGTSMVRSALIQNAYTPSWSGTTTVYVRLTSGTGNIGNGTVTNLSAGKTRFALYLQTG